MEIWLKTLAQAVRRLRRKPLTTIVIVVSLALGIGANTAIFSVVNTLLMRPLPVRDADRLVFTLDMREEDDPFEAALLDYIAFRDSRAFVSTGVAHRESFNLVGSEQPERLEAAAVSQDYLPTLGVEPQLGRGFQPSEDRPGAAPVALISDALWKRRFGGDPQVVGRSINLDGVPRTVLGVMPRGFDLPLGTEVWVPLGVVPETLPLDDQAAHDYLMVARLAPGVSLEAANHEAGRLAKQLASEYPDQREGWGIRLIPLRQQILGDIQGTMRPALYLLLGVVGFLLLITCVNVANLLLVRSFERSRDVAVQTALGAERRRLVGQLLAESLVLAVAGGAAGLLVAYWATPPLMAMSPVQAFALEQLFERPRIDGAVLLFTLAVAALTGVLFGLAPAMWSSRPQRLADQLKAGGRKTSAGRGERRFLAGLVVAEIMVAVMLLVGAGVMIGSFREVQEVDLGFAPERRLAVEMFLSDADYPEHAQRIQFVEQVLERVRSLPGVRDAATTTTIPLAISTWDIPYSVEGKPPVDESEVPIAAYRLVSPGYLEMMEIDLVAGRYLAERDRTGGTPAVVVSEELVRREWPGQDPLGKQVIVGSPPSEDAPRFLVVGVVEDVQEDRFNFGIDRPVWYLPYFQRETGLPVSLVVLAAGDPADLAPAVRQAIWSINPNQPIAGIVTLEEHLAEFLGPQRFSVVLTGAFALLGLVLAALGLYGIMSYTVGQERREIGIRMALGAPTGSLLGLVLARGLRLVVAGLLLGLAAGVLLTRLLAGTVADAAGVDAPLLGAVAAILLAVGLLAVYLPARRTTKVDPNLALRYE